MSTIQTLQTRKERDFSTPCHHKYGLHTVHSTPLSLNLDRQTNPIATQFYAQGVNLLSVRFVCVRVDCAPFHCVLFSCEISNTKATQICPIDSDAFIGLLLTIRPLADRKRGVFNRLPHLYRHEKDERQQGGDFSRRESRRSVSEDLSDRFLHSERVVLVLLHCCRCGHNNGTVKWLRFAGIKTQFITIMQKSPTMLERSVFL